MTPLEQAAADLREANANLKAHTPIADLENAVKVAEAALITAASTPPAKPFNPSEVETTTFTVEEAADAAEAVAEAVQETLDRHFPDDEDEVAVASEPSTDADDLFEEAAIPEVDVNVKPVDSAAMQDVIESVSAAAETIDATDEVSVEEAVEAAEPEADPNAHLGVNYPANGLAQAE